MENVNKYSNWIIHHEDQNPIFYPEAFDLQLKNNDNNYSVIIVPPHGRFKNFLFIFPSDTHLPMEDRVTKSVPHPNFILYARKWFPPDKLFRTTFEKPTQHSIEWFLEAKFQFPMIFKFNYHFFELVTEQYEYLRKEAFQPIKQLLTKKGFLSKDNRGQDSSEEKRIKKILRQAIVKAYRTSKRKRPLPLAFIKKKMDAKLSELFPDNSEAYDRYALSDSTIRRYLKEVDLI